jgi:hypothetical protein
VAIKAGLRLRSFYRWRRSHPFETALRASSE